MDKHKSQGESNMLKKFEVASKAMLQPYEHCPTNMSCIELTG